MNFKNLEDKCLYYRSLSDYRLVPNQYVIMMLDGRAFSKLIKNKYEKPFDNKFIHYMNETAKYLCKNIGGCKFAYVQSDEITMVLSDFDTPTTDTFFGYRLCKLQSIAAAMAASKFNHMVTMDLLNTPCSQSDMIQMVEYQKLVEFDCKAWNVDDANDAMAWFLFRNIDCIRNSKQQAAQAYLSHKQLIGKTADEQIELLKQTQNINWGNYFDGWKYGRILEKEDVEMSLGENTFTRSIWKAKDGCDLTITENRNKLFEKYFQDYLER